MQKTHQNSVNTLLVSLAALALCFFSSGASAHTSGAAYEQKSGAYTTDIGYSPTIFTASDYASFDFLLWRGPVNTGEPADYAQVWVRIIHEKNTLLATGIFNQPFGPTGLLYDFARPGEYVLEASFRTEEGDEIASSTFPITVEKSPDAFPLDPYGIPLLSGFLALIVGALLAHFGPRLLFRKK